MPLASRSRLALPVVSLAAAATALLAWAAVSTAPEESTAASESPPAAAASGRAGAPPTGDPPPCALGAEACAGPDGHAGRAGSGAPAGAPAAAPAAPGAPQLLEFEAAYCAACATMAPVVSSIVRSCAKASAVVRRIDVARTEGEALAEHYRVDALPTFLAVDAEGHEVFRRVGVQAPAELAALVAEVSGEACAAKN